MSKKVSVKDIISFSSKASVVEKEIKFISIDGEECEGHVYIKKLGYQAIMDLQKAITWDIDEKNLENSKVKAVDIIYLQAMRILHTVCSDISGTPLFNDVDQIYDLVPTLGFALYGASDEVNNFSGKSINGTSSKTSSGQSLSSTASEAAPLKKRRAGSHTQKRVSG